MAEVEIYSSMLCPYCWRAKKLLESKGVDFTEVDVLANPRRKPEMIERAGGSRTVPQIFIDGQHVGGSDELADLEKTGQLDTLLGSA